MNLRSQQWVQMMMDENFQSIFLHEVMTLHLNSASKYQVLLQSAGSGPSTYSPDPMASVEGPVGSMSQGTGTGMC